MNAKEYFAELDLYCLKKEFKTFYIFFNNILKVY